MESDSPLSTTLNDSYEIQPTISIFTQFIKYSSVFGAQSW